MSSSPHYQNALDLAIAIALGDDKKTRSLLTPDTYAGLLLGLLGSGKRSDFAGTLAERAAAHNTGLTFIEELANQANAQISDPWGKFHSSQISCRKGDARIGALLTFSKQPDAIFAIAELLSGSGWAPSNETSASLLAVASGCHGASSSERLLWLAERGLLSSAAPLGQVASTHICNALAAQTPADLTVLRRLAEIGLLRDADGALGHSDFMAHHLYECAEALAQLGFKPRALTHTRRFNLEGMSAVSSYMRLVNEFDPRSEAELDAAIQKVERDLDRLHAMGASFAASDPRSLLYGDQMAADPFAASLNNRPTRQPLGSRPASALCVAAYDKLKALGADPNATGEYLAGEVSHRGWWGEVDGLFDNALRLGADPTLRPGLLLSAPACWGGAMGDQAIAWMDKLIALGADITACPTLSDPREHPLAYAILGKNIAYANAVLDRGAPPGWVDSDTGATCFHALAPQLSKQALALAQRLLALPSGPAVMDRKTNTAYGKTGEETPLMRACAALNAPLVTLLLAAGANPNAIDERGNTPLHHAGRKYGATAQKKCAALIGILLAGGADPSIANTAGLTPGQAMAKRAPLDGLTELLSLRPEDLTGPGAGAKLASAALLARGQQATSVVEKAILSSDAPSSPAPRKARSRL